VRDISSAVTVQGADNTSLDVGRLHLGVYEDGVEAAVEDTRLQTSLLLLAIFGVGMLLIIGLVQVFVEADPDAHRRVCAPSATAIWTASST
jgi:hypothetical protein